MTPARRIRQKSRIALRRRRAWPAAVAACLAGVGWPAEPSAAQHETLALLPLRSTTLDPGIVKVLDHLLIVAVDEMHHFQVITPADIEAIIGQQRIGDQLGCDDAVCAAEIGDTVNAAYLLTGTADRLGGYLILTLTLRSTRGTALPRRESLRVADRESLYAWAIDEVAEMIFAPTDQAAMSAALGSIQPSPAPPSLPVSPPEAPTATRGALHITSRPPSRIYIDGVDTGRNTPAVLRVTSGPHSVVLTSVAGGVWQQRVEVGVDALVEIEAEIDREPEVPVTRHMLGAGTQAELHWFGGGAVLGFAEYQLNVFSWLALRARSGGGVFSFWGVTFPVFYVSGGVKASIPIGADWASVVAVAGSPIQIYASLDASARLGLLKIPAATATLGLRLWWFSAEYVVGVADMLEIIGGLYVLHGVSVGLHFAF